jgi:transposase
MSVSKELSVRQRIGAFYERNKHMKKSLIVNHFKLEGIPPATIYRVINRVDKGIGLTRKPGTSLWRKISDKKKNKIFEECVNEVGISYASVGRKHQISDHKVKEVLIEAGIKRKMRTKAPKTNENQSRRQQKCLQKLRRDFLKPSNGDEVIIDDESYFTVDGCDGYGNDFYYASDLLEPPLNVKYKNKSKFPKKVMVWLAIRSRGFSDPMIKPSGNAINAQIYINECVSRLNDFINKYHSDGKYIFWPDLASSHYANATLEEFQRLKIKIVPKNANPPNCPQLRPIERFWANLKKKVYEKDWTAQTPEELIKKIKSELRKMPSNTCQNLMRRVKTKVRTAADRGVLSVHN